ncbi:uncharacterized protein [Hemitrygon akajei]|uniref:uncharacterized protein n=1 Tax=Hemitrygon akajei TaxID=2704970 RepID=UPI003BF9EB7F
MDRSVSYMTVNMGRKDSRSPSRAEPDVSYAEVNFKRSSAPRVRADRDALNSTYSELNFRKEEPLIDEHEDSPIASGSSGLSATAKTAAQERESKVNIGNRPYRLICLLCLVTFAFIVTVAGLSIHVSQIRYKFTEMETKYRSVNESKAQICELLNSRRELCIPQPCVWNLYILDWKMRKQECELPSPVQGVFGDALLQSLEQYGCLAGELNALIAGHGTAERSPIIKTTSPVRSASSYSFQQSVNTRGQHIPPPGGRVTHPTLHNHFTVSPTE